MLNQQFNLGASFVARDDSRDNKRDATSSSSMAMGSGLSEPTLPLSLNTESSPGANLTPEVAQFFSDAPLLDAGLPPTSSISDISPVPPNADLGTFLGRPLEVRQQTWTPATASAHFDPWVSFLGDPIIQEKLRGWRYVRGTLHVSCQYNGTPFHFGRIMLSYEPCHWNRISIDGDARQHSGNQHILIDPSTNVVAQFKCPFVSPYNWIDRSAAANQISNSPYNLIDPSRSAALGVINIDVLAPLSVFQGGTPSPVELSFYCWMTDVQLAMPYNGTQTGFTAQGDEYTASGVVSAPAAAIAGAAARFSAAPYLGKYAIATSIAAGSISRLASLFGFSRPRSLDPPALMIQNISGNMVNVDAADSSTSLTFNSKSETAVGPGITGFDPDCDELAIRSIACRWTYMASMNWSRTQAPYTELLSAGVGPNLFTTTIATHTNYPSALAYAAYPFDYWHGSIQVKVIIVASRFHRGRLRFMWAPRDTLNTEVNLTYSKIVDISGTREYCITLPYVCSEGYKKVIIESTTGISRSYQAEQHSGVFKVLVQNTLVAPTDEPIRILYYVRGGPDIRFAAPTDTIKNYSIYSDSAAPALMAEEGEGFEQQSGTLAELGVSASVDCEDIEFIPLSELPKYDLAYYGDPIVSFRALLKRYTSAASVNLNTVPAINNVYSWIFTWPLYPQMRKFIAGGLWQFASPNSPGVYSNLHPIAYFSALFLGRRGGTRSLILSPNNMNVHTWRSPYIISRVLAKVKPFNFSVVGGLTTGAITGILFDGASGLTGSQAFSTDPGNMRVQVETPFYSPLKYCSAVEAGLLVNGVTVTDTLIPKTFTGNRLTYVERYGATVPNTIDNPLAIWMAAAEDFNVLFFRGVPVLKFSFVGILSPLQPVYNSTVD